MRQAVKQAAASAPLAVARPAVPSMLRNSCASTSASTSTGVASRSHGRSSSSRRSFASTARARREGDGGAPPPPQHGRSPWAAFKETLKAELEKSREWQDTAKQLGGEVGKVQDSATMRRARELYEKARVRRFVENTLRCAGSTVQASAPSSMCGRAHIRSSWRRSSRTLRSCARPLG